MTRINNKKIFTLTFTIFCAVFLFQINDAQALTPIARFDVVPYQRINSGETLNVGVVAFSKNGIDRVEFTVSGQGYTGVNPLVSRAMTHNPQTDVWEYWVPIEADDFTSDGNIEITAVAYGEDGGFRDKNWLMEGVFGINYDLDCQVESEGNAHDYYCNIISEGLFSESMLFSEVIFYDASDDWWNGIHEDVQYIDNNTLKFYYGSSYGVSPIELSYKPALGDKFILNKSYGLNTLPLLVNPNGTLPQPVAYVDVAGNDTSGAVNDSSKPYLTIGRAMLGLSNWMNTNGFGNKINGAVVKLNPGTHTMSNGSVWNSILSEDEWFIISANEEVGGNKDNTTIYAGSFVNTQYVKTENLTLSAENNGGNVISVASNFYHLLNLWVDNCNLIGDNKFNELSNPVSSRNLWYTNSYFTNMGQAVSEAKLARGIREEGLGNDAFVRTPLVINAYANDIDPRDGTCVDANCAHADCWQWWGAPVPNNAIIYNYQCLNSAYQGLFARSQDGGGSDNGFQNPPIEGMAIVNMQTHLVEDAYGAANAWTISANHMLMWHNTFNDEFSFWNDDMSDYGGGTDVPLNIKDFDVRGNNFYDVELNAPLGDDNGGDAQAPGVELSSWQSNHYRREAGYTFFKETPGLDISVGDPLVDTDSRPILGSPLINRLLTPVITVDTKNGQRDLSPDIGAFEFVEFGNDTNPPVAPYGLSVL